MNEDSSDEMNVRVVKRIKFQEPDWEELNSCVNPELFKSYNGHPISFHFKIDDLTLKTKFEDIVVSFGGNKVENYLDMGNRTALMVTEDYYRQYLFDRPSFKVSYIVNCIKKNELLDITQYLHNYFTLKPNNYMNIFYWENDAFRTKSVEPCIDSSDEETQETSVNKHTREMYSRCEKEAILKFLISRKKRTGFRGNSVWKEMEKKRICPKRTYQSLKNHFLKTLLFELDKFEFLSAEDKIMLKNR